MKREWGVCFKCEKVIPYEIEGKTTTFPPGEFWVHNDSIVTGFKSRKGAEKHLKEDPYEMRRKG